VLRIYVERLPLVVSTREERHLGLKALPLKKGNYSARHLLGFPYYNHLLYYLSILVKTIENEENGYIIKSLRRGALKELRTSRFNRL
jgi:hypothetical protein